MYKHKIAIHCLYALWVSAAFLAVGSTPAQSCTTFMLPNSPAKWVAKSLDWYQSDGMLVMNPRGLAKKALVLTAEPKPDALKPLQWTSRHGSVTFNQVGREFPYGGMNEKGLVVEIMWLEESKLPPLSDPRPAVNESQWIQYILDLAASAPEAADLAKQVFVAKTFADVHYMVCDAAGVCATFEYLKGELVVHMGVAGDASGEMPVSVLTNNTYADSNAYLKTLKGWGGDQEIPATSASLARFARAADRVRSFTPANGDAALADSWKYAFETLESVHDSDGPSVTQWQILYSPVQREVMFRTRAKSEIKIVRLPREFPHCREGSRVFDLSSDHSGDVTSQLVPYTPQFNQEVISRVSFLPETLKPYLVAYPAAFTRCE